VAVNSRSGLRRKVVPPVLWVDRRFRALTARQRALPDFLILGTQKGGTTSLYHYLSQHPDVLPAYRKEVHFFDSHRYQNGPLEYRAMFPLQARLDLRGRRTGRTTLTGEASPFYLSHPTTAERARELVPDAKLIVLLRDPCERAFSHYRQNVRWNREPLSFADAIDAEAERLREPLKRACAGVDEDRGAALPRYSYVLRGHYADQLDRWHEFYPGKQFLILRSEDLLDKPEATYKRVLAFLGLTPVLPDRFELRNAHEPVAMDPAARARLAAVFAPGLDRLHANYGIDLRA